MPGNLSLVELSRFSLLALIFLIVTLGIVTITPMILSRVAVRRRLPEIRGVREGLTTAGSLRTAEVENFWTRLVKEIEQRGVSLADSDDRSVRAKLIAAGYTHPQAPALFTLVRIVMTLGLPAMFVIFFLATSVQPSIMKLYVGAVLLAVAGLYLPNIFIAAKRDRRQRELLNGFPDALDLMLVCVEAGLGIDAAFQRVGKEIVHSHPLLAEQLAAVTLELRAGRGREDALRRMADRAGIAEIRAFATLIIQSEKLGSSIAQTLRIYAGEMRERRKLRAEEKAHRLPVLLSVPLVACMLPTMIGVLMLPAVIRVIRVMLPAMGG